MEKVGKMDWELVLLRYIYMYMYIMGFHVTENPTAKNKVL